MKITSSAFLLAFILGIIFALIFLGLRGYIPKIINAIRRKFIDFRESFSTSAENRIRNDIYDFAQKQHIAASLFSLDEIVIEPKVLTPLVHIPSSVELATTDSVNLTVPYVPDWPELAAVYNASTMTLIEALQGDANIVLAGHPGCGKTVALAWLSACLARKVKGLGILADMFPVYIHATDIPNIIDLHDSGHSHIDDLLDDVGESDQQKLNKVTNAEAVVNLLVEAMSVYVSPVIQQRLFRFIHFTLENQRVILLVDRVDELPSHQAKVITSYIQLLLDKYPKLRIVVGMSYDCLAGLPLLGFNLLGLASWSNSDRANLVNRWSQQWIKWIAPSEKSTTKKVRSHYLKSWLNTGNNLLKPLEYTLKVWAAFAGDILGADGPSAIEAHIRRMTSNNNDNRAGLEQFALQLLVESTFASNPFESKRLLSEFNNAIQASSMPLLDGEVISQPLPLKIPQIKNISNIETLSNNGFLLNYPGSRFGFSNPVINGYLAGKALSESGVIEKVLNQPAWMGKNIALYYLARYGDVTSLIQHYLQDDDILHTNHLYISRWLQVAPKNRAWRTIILRTLTSILQKEKETICLAGKIIAAMAFSGDVGVSIYFRQLLRSDHPNLKQLAALGCGILADKNSIDDLNKLLQEPSPTMMRAACLALAAVGDKHSLEILASNLLNGDESVRRFAAEALANNQSEGYPALKDGSSMEDLLVRRAVVFGLIRINQSWARKIVENLQLEDNEWVVRNAAIQAFEELQRQKNYVPSSPPDLTETQWLINYSQKIGTSIAPGKPAEELVGKVLVDGSQDEKILAMDYFRNKCDPKSLDLVFSVYTKSKGDLRNSAYYVLWLMLLAGLPLPLSVE